ncbi:hypothetical protein HMPREF1602_05136 [Escherichia coli 907889]|nr:hypothetical protein HMPREF1588_00585 [Escherichia coli 110957]ESD31235.1 hypothetical protein HMPREF1602_05136 [Escherichia coli 907889]
MIFNYLLYFLPNHDDFFCANREPNSAGWLTNRRYLITLLRRYLSL